MAQLTTNDGRCIEGIWVPIEIWDSDLPPLEKILYIEIHSYTIGGKEIPMANKDVSKFLGITENWASQIVSKLSKRGLIRIRHDGRTRWVQTAMVNGKNELFGMFLPQSKADFDYNQRETPMVELQSKADFDYSQNLLPESKADFDCSQRVNPPHTPPTIPTTSSVNNKPTCKEEKENIIKEKEDFDKAYRDLFTDAYNSTQWRELQERNHRGIDWAKAYAKFRDHIVAQGRTQDLATMNVSRFMAWFSNAAPYFLTGCGTIELGPGEEITPDGKRRCWYAACWNPIPMDAPPRPEGQYVWDGNKWKHSDDVAYARKTKNNV